MSQRRRLSSKKRRSRSNSKRSPSSSTPPMRRFCKVLFSHSKISPQSAIRAAKAKKNHCSYYHNRKPVDAAKKAINKKGTGYVAIYDPKKKRVYIYHGRKVPIGGGGEIVERGDVDIRYRYEAHVKSVGIYSLKEGSYGRNH